MNSRFSVRAQKLLREMGFRASGEQEDEGTCFALPCPCLWNDFRPWLTWGWEHSVGPDFCS